MKKQLLEYCFKYRKEYIYEVSQREFDCLVELVESGTITTFEELSEYGMKY
jgi:predicted transcriptional regulator